MKTTPRKVTRNEQVNLIDLFYYLIGNWYWFLLCILVALGIAFYHYSRMPFMYSSGVTAIIKNPGDDIRSARLETYDQMINKVSVTNEELQLRSLTIMTEVVKALNADVNYVERIKFRNVELYTSLSPVRMAFNREKDDPGSINVTVTPADARTATTEAIGTLLMYELIREAGLRLPKVVGGAVSIVGGLIIGDAAVASGLVSTPMLTVTAIAVTSGFIVPDLNPALTILRLSFILVGGMFGLCGLALGLTALCMELCRTEIFTYPLTAPLAPFTPGAMRDVAYRQGWKRMGKGGFAVGKLKK